MNEHIIFDAQGTRYDLVLVSDPYGGILVIWPATGQVWRWHRDDRLKPLGNNNEHDGNNIFHFLESL